MQGCTATSFWYMFPHICKVTNQRVEKEKEINIFIFSNYSSMVSSPHSSPISKMRS